MLSDTNLNSFLMSPGLFMDIPEKVNYLKLEEADFIFQNEKVCSFTGYRPEKFDFCKESDSRCTDLKFRLCAEINKLILCGYTSFISGMARGVDIWAAELVLHLARTSHKEIKLYAAVPFPEQPETWYEWEKERYDEILHLCKGVFVIEEYYTQKSMNKRNEFLVKYADSIISVFDGKPGGTSNTLTMAGKKKVNIINIVP